MKLFVVSRVLAALVIMIMAATASAGKPGACPPPIGSTYEGLPPDIRDASARGTKLCREERRVRKIVFRIMLGTERDLVNAINDPSSSAWVIEIAKKNYLSAFKVWLETNQPAIAANQAVVDHLLATSFRQTRAAPGSDGRKAGDRWQRAYVKSLQPVTPDQGLLRRADEAIQKRQMKSGE
ncbi:MAG TPA: hypothetical protein VMT81_03190 [Candidatus Paceibacterota bacterium]|nr:hypothetical protein [Candidatus Paceibacterota bacterium]